MKRIVIAICCLWFSVTEVAAATVYISENIRMVIRQGPGSQHKILETLLSGDMLEMVEEGPEWSRVRLPDGREGWAPTRFLTSQIPCSLTLKRLEQQLADLQNASDPHPGPSRNDHGEDQRLSLDLAEMETRFNTLSDDYEELKKESEEILTWREKNQAMATYLEERTRELENWEKKLGEETFSLRLRWFLSGAGVLVAGFVLGWLCKRPRTRHSLLR